MSFRSCATLALPLAAALAACTVTTGDAAGNAATAGDPGEAFPVIGQLTAYADGFHSHVPGDARIERLTDPQTEGFTWSEGPAWVRDGDGGYLLFTDVPGNTMHRWSDAEGLSVFLQPSGYGGPDDGTLREAGANGLFAEPGGTVLLADSGSRLVARFDPATKAKTPLATHFDGKRFNSPNDVVLRSDGAVFFTDPPYGLKDGNDSPAKELAFNGVYRIDADGSVHLLDDSLTYPNGIALSPDERTLYVAVSDPEQPVWMAYALDDAGDVSGRRVFADASDLMGEGVHGLPDGLVVATDGTLFATGPGGVLVIAADGTRLGRIETGSAIANCTFGDDGRTLYMTSNDFLARVRTHATGLGADR
ncbi:SMP-30/gluconolactonase/LRE family protein [Luteimonas aestuarii]|uniref:SMP-30/gluconolactonase/LRE family protein n=1 Tax=Luteimonas aestuarii TaxID=453837 RepID=A0A4R5U4L1_9GAMM|nr:SMP-30/gluconolactonase/LRE family protein [Luteimonas aestuarii]